MLARQTMGTVVTATSLCWSNFQATVFADKRFIDMCELALQPAPPRLFI